MTPEKVKERLTGQHLKQLKLFARSRKIFAKLLFFTVFDYNYLQGRTVHGSGKKQGMDEDVVEYLKHLVLTTFPVAAGLSSAAAWQECINAMISINDLIRFLLSPTSAGDGGMP